MPEFVSDEMVEDMPKIMSYIVSHGGDYKVKGFINGQVEYKGKVQYSNALQTLKIQLDDYEQGSKERAVLKKCISQIDQFNVMQKQSNVSALNKC